MKVKPISSNPFSKQAENKQYMNKQMSSVIPTGYTIVVEGQIQVTKLDKKATP